MPQQRWPVLVLQHPAERRQAKGSATLLRLSLPHCELQVTERWEPPPRSAAGEPLDFVLLYPATPGAGPAPVFDVQALSPSQAESPQAPEANTSAASTEPAGSHPRLIVLDATWRHSRAMLRASPALQALPRLALHEPPTSRYAPLRRAPQPAQQRSTLEAVCLALAQLEQAPQRYNGLLSAFGAWVAHQAAWVGRVSAPAEAPDETQTPA